MTGSLQKKTLADGREYYYMVLNFYEKHTKKRKPKWIPTGLPVKGNKRKAEQMLIDNLAQYQEKSYDATADMLFCDWIELWLETTKTYVERSTWESYLLSAKHVIKYFREKKLTLIQLKPKHFREYYTYMLTSGKVNAKTSEQSGLSVRTVQGHKFIMNAALNEAVVEEIISRNPALNIKVSNAKKKSLAKKIVFFTLEESNEFLKYIYDENDILSDLIYVTLYYGLRRSEVVALTEDSLDFEKHLLKIEKTTVTISTTQKRNKTKTPDSNRTYPLTEEMELFFKRVIEKKRSNKLYYGNTYIDSDELFVWDDGHPFRPDFIYHHFKKIVTKFGRPDMTFHALRHSTASILVKMNWHPKDIQEWLGHADFYTTMNIYSHIAKIYHIENANRMTGLLLMQNTM